MTKHSLDLDGGAFKVNLPYTFGGWLVFVVCTILVFAGIVLSFDDMTFLALSAVGFFIMAGITPGSHEATLHNLRKNAISPSELEAKAEASGMTVENWWLQQTSYVPTNDPNDWILPAPGPTTWNKENPYVADEGGQPLPEHPVNVGTPTPATFSLFGVFLTLAILIGLYTTSYVMSDDMYEGGALPAYIFIAIGLFGALGGAARAKMLRQMMDLPTSLVRSAPVGYPELVGQVRPTNTGAMTVVVDGNSNMVMHNMVGFRWSYEQYQCRTVKDNEGNTREECNWVQIRSDQGGCPFILHDGTGGIKVNTTSFKRTEYGKFLKQWDGAVAQSLGKQLMSQAMAGILRDARVEKHRWTLWGLRIGNPVYLIGQTKPRPQTELQSEGIDGTLGNSIIEVWGNEDESGTKCTLQRGSELSNLGSARSGVELILVPLLMLFGGLALLGLA